MEDYIMAMLSLFLSLSLSMWEKKGRRIKESERRLDTNMFSVMFTEMGKDI